MLIQCLFECTGMFVCAGICRCVLQGSVLASHARLEDHVTLKECQVGTRFTVTKEGVLEFVDIMLFVMV